MCKNKFKSKGSIIKRTIQGCKSYDVEVPLNI